MLKCFILSSNTTPTLSNIDFFV